MLVLPSLQRTTPRGGQQTVLRLFCQIIIIERLRIIMMSQSQKMGVGRLWKNALFVAKQKKKKKNDAVVYTFHSSPFYSIPVQSSPFHSIPFHFIPFHSIPFHSIPVHSSVCTPPSCMVSCYEARHAHSTNGIVLARDWGRAISS